VEAQNDGDDDPNNDINGDEDGDNTDAVRGDRMKEFWFWRESDERELEGHDDGVKAQITEILALTTYLEAAISI
jgi:hypothetical protein